jgi:thiamine transporter 2/3
LYQYQNEDLNISDRVLNGDVYPYWTYSYLIALVPVFLLTDILLYKPVLMMESVSYVAVWATLIWGTSVWTQQVGQALYGWATATEIAYYAYIYVKIEKEQYRK